VSDLARLAAEGKAKKAAFGAEAGRAAQEQTERNISVALGAHFGSPLQRLLRNAQIAAIAAFVVGLLLLWSEATTEKVAMDVIAFGGLVAFVLLFVRVFRTPTANAATHAAEDHFVSSLPFAFSGYFDALGATPRAMCRLSFDVQFASRAPAPDVFAGVVQRTDPGAALAANAWGWAGSPISGHTGIRINKVPVHRNHRIVKYVHDVVEQVLLPMHREYPIASVTLTRNF
jgi:hypothetical protein